MSPSLDLRAWPSILTGIENRIIEPLGYRAEAKRSIEGGTV